jgi:hypothetical protein
MKEDGQLTRAQLLDRRKQTTLAAVEGGSFPQLLEPYDTGLPEGTPECLFPVGLTVTLGALTREQYLGRLGERRLGDLKGFSLRSSPLKVDLAFVAGTELGLAEGARLRPLAEIYAAAVGKGLSLLPLEVLAALEAGCFEVVCRPVRTFWVATGVPFVDCYGDGIQMGMFWGSSSGNQIVTAGVDFAYKDYLVNIDRLFAFRRPRLG